MGYLQGDIVLAEINFSDGSEAVCRPTLLLVEVAYGDFIACILTHQQGPRFDKRIPLVPDDIIEGDFIADSSYIRPHKVICLDPNIIAKKVGRVSTAKLDEVLGILRSTFIREKD